MKWLAGVLGALAALLIVFLAVGLWNATRPPVVVRMNMELAGLPPGRQVRVLLMSDIHFGYPDMRTRRLLGIVARANALKPDLILLAGDYMGGKLLDWPGSMLEEALPPLAGLKAPLGVFAVPGNHDEQTWTPRIMANLVRPTLLVNRNVDVGPLVVAGIDTIAHSARPGQALAGIPAGKPVLVLRHEGDAMQYLPPLRANPAIALAGHTHGGQVVLPFVGSVGDRWSGDPLCRRGLCEVNGWRLLVTSGVGTSVLPIRFGVAPEMVLITLRAPDAAYSTGRKSATER